MLLPEARKRINAKNKARAKAMEQRIAKYLNGNRVPMSGSGTLKGDCFVPFDEYRTIYVECKLTEKEKITMYQAWLEKVDVESKAMRCIFGMIVVHFIMQRGDYTFIPVRVIPLLQRYDPYFAKDVPVHGLVYEKLGIEFRRTMTANVPVIIQTLHGNWLIIELSALKDVLSKVTEENDAL